MKNQDILDNVLDDNEKLSLQMFVDNNTQREAVKKVLLFGVYHNGVLEKGKAPNPLLNFALGLVSNRVDLKLTDEELGRHLGVQWEAIQLLELAFSNLFKYKKEENQKVAKDNPAR